MAVDIEFLNANSITNLNNNFTRVKDALQETLGRNGDTPNEMNADLDMNSNDILNVRDIKTQTIEIDGTDIHDIKGRGWSPIYGAVDKGNGDIVLQLSAWVDGTGATPINYIGWYLGPIGLTPNINEATTMGGGGGAISDGVRGDVEVSGGGGVWSVPRLTIESRSWAIASFHPIVAPSFIETAGYLTPGDGGGAIYRKVASMPSHSGRFSITQSNLETIWYEVAPANELPIRVFGALGDGVTPDTAALASAVAFSAANGNIPIVIEGGVFYIDNNVTVNAPIRITGNSAFAIASGATITFTIQPTIDPSVVQAFRITGTGGVAGLKSAEAQWFVGLKIGTGTVMDAEMQKLADSVVNNAIIRFPAGTYRLSGAAPIEFTKGQQVFGSGRAATQFQWNSTVCFGFRFSGNFTGVAVRDFTMINLNEFDVPTSGEALRFETYLWTANNIRLSGGYTALFAGKQGKITQFDINDFRYQGIHINGHADTYASQGIVTSPSSYVSLTPLTGTFTPGERLTWSGQDGDIISIWTNSAGTKAKVPFGRQIPALSTVITGMTSGATARITAITHSMENGSLFINGAGETHLFTDIDFTGGKNIIRMVPGISTKLLNICFEQCQFDGAHERSVAIENGYGTKFTNCFFSARSNLADHEVYIADSVGTTFVNTQIVNSGRGWLDCAPTSRDTQIIGGHLMDYNTKNVAESYGIRIGSNATASIRDFRIGKANYFPNFADRGVAILSGARVFMENVDLRDLPASGRVFDGNAVGSGLTVINSCPGYRTYMRGIAELTGGSIVINHTLPFTPNEADISLFNLSSTARGLTLSDINGTSFTVSSSTPGWFKWEVRGKQFVL